MTLQSRLLLPSLVLVLTLAQPCLAGVRSTSQFDNFFTTFDSWYHNGIKENCSVELARYNDASEPDPPNAGHHIAWNLVNCLLDNMTEVVKLELAVSAILLALVPTALAQIGPSLAETSFLSMRRPLLALLLTISTPAPNPSRGNLYADPVTALDDKRGLGHVTRLRESKNIAVCIAISAVEYAIAIVVAGNCVFQVYRLTFKAVALAPIVVLLPGVPEHYVLFGWILILVPIQILCVVGFYLAFSQDSPSPRPWFLRVIMDELTPCCYGRSLSLKPRDGLWTSLFYFSINFITNFSMCAHIMLGTVLLGSVLFITVADVLPVVESFVAAALASRVVLVFELQGLRAAHQETLPKPQEEDEQPSASSPLMGHSGGDSKNMTYESQFDLSRRRGAKAEIAYPDSYLGSIVPA